MDTDNLATMLVDNRLIAVWLNVKLRYNGSEILIDSFDQLWIGETVRAH